MASAIKSEHCTATYFSPWVSAFWASGFQGGNGLAAASLLHRQLGQIQFRDDFFVGFGGALRRLRSPLVKFPWPFSSRRGKKRRRPRIPGSAPSFPHSSVPAKDSTHPQDTWPFISPARRDQDVAITAQYLHHPERAIFQVRESLERLLLGIERRPKPPLVLEQDPAIRLNRASALVPDAAPQIECAPGIG